MSPEDIDQVIATEFVSVSSILTTFRENTEQSVRSPIELIDQNACILIGDIAFYLGLGKNKIREVLGYNGFAIWQLAHDLKTTDQR